MENYTLTSDIENPENAGVPRWSFTEQNVNHFDFLSERLALLDFFFPFLSPVFHELWHSMMSTCLITEVRQQWATLVLGWVTA